MPAIFSLDANSLSNLVSAASIFLSVSLLKKSLSPLSSLDLAWLTCNWLNGSLAAVAAVWNILPCGGVANIFKPKLVKKPGSPCAWNVGIDPWLYSIRPPWA